MIKWPIALVNEMARRRCILFIGAGVSSSSQTPEGRRPPGWKDFIHGAINLVPSEADKSEIKQFLDDRDLTLALEAVVESSDKGDYQAYLNENFNVPQYQPSNLHETIYELDAKVVVTTNFDKIYESYCLQQGDQGYKVIRYNEDSIIDEIRSDTYLVIKAHGCIDNMAKMIFTKSQYHQAKRDHVGFYEILKGLFLTHTVIFIGCGMADPDVLLLLEEVKNIGSSTKPHYMIIKEGQSKFLKNDWLSTYNIKALEYSGVEHEELSTNLQRFSEMVQARRGELKI